MPFSIAVFSPPNWDREYTRCYGFELEDIFAFGLRSVKTKWRATGYPLERDAPGVLPLDHAEPEEEVAVGQIKLLERGGARRARRAEPESSPEVQRLYFEMIARLAPTPRRSTDTR